MKTVLLSNRYEGQLKEILEKLVGDRFRLKMLNRNSKEALLHEIADSDYLLYSGQLELDSDILKAAGNLKMIQRTGVGVDRIDLETLKNLKIPLYVNKGVNAGSVAEYTVMLMLETIKNNRVISYNMTRGKWEKYGDGITVHELSGKTIGIIGMGNVGRAVASMLAGFNVRKIYYSRTRISGEDERRLCVDYRDLDTLLSVSDIISLHCSYDKRIGPIINSSEMERMKKGAIIINTARGKLIEEKALIDSLESGRIAAAGLDTFSEEPLSPDSQLRGMKQVVLSPHIAGLSFEAYERMLSRAIDNIVCFDNGNTEDIRDSLYPNE